MVPPIRVPRSRASHVPQVLNVPGAWPGFVKAPEDYYKARGDSSSAPELQEGSLEEVACALAPEDQNDLERG